MIANKLNVICFLWQADGSKIEIEIELETALRFYITDSVMFNGYRNVYQLSHRTFNFQENILVLHFATK